MDAQELKETKLPDIVSGMVEELDADLYLYAGDIQPQGYDRVCAAFAKNLNPRPNAALFLNTYGGDAHAAYRIARAFGHHYKTLTLYVFGDCKSAGTLLALGFNRIVIGDRGELGPMDVQMASKEELFEYNSGLDMIQAMDFLQRHAKDAFHGFLRDIRINTRLGTKSAGEMARQLTQGLFAGMYGQLDPVRLGHVQRTMRITHAYGTRLVARSRSLKSEKALEQLVYRYPSHDFVIDRREAREALFDEDVVRCPSNAENILGQALYAMNPADQGETIDFLALHEILNCTGDLKTEQPESTTACEPPKGEPTTHAKKRNRKTG